MPRCLLALATGIALCAGLPSCSDALVQTAYRPAVSDGGDSSGALCDGSAASSELPPGAAFGEGDPIASWPLAALSYGALEGPGLYVTARDTFRVYVNGQLVGQSAAARTPLFVPLSLPPGENVIAVTVHSASGTPAALVQLDELERSYVSASDWKWSASPEGDWRAPGYDDGSWANARELAAFGDLPGCDPTDSFPASTTGRWIGPDLGTGGPIALRKVVRIEPVGYGAKTSGGAGAEPRIVSGWEELESLAASDEPATLVLPEGVHDFRRTAEDVEVCPSVCSEHPDKRTYQVLTSGSSCAEELVTMERDDRILRVGSNKTILGLGRGAALRGVSFDLQASRNVIVRNVALYDINASLLEAGDAFTLSGASGIWIDHVTTKWVSDAFADVLSGTGGLTISYALFDGSTDAECAGQERWALTLTDSQATIHHCRFDSVRTRAPMVDGPDARVHLFNNVYSNITDWAVGASCLAQVLMEGSVFESSEAATRLSTCSESSDRGLMNAVAGSNLYRDESAVHIGADGTEPHDEVFFPEYPYSLEPARDALPRVISHAGAGGPWALPLDAN